MKKWYVKRTIYARLWICCRNSNTTKLENVNIFFHRYTVKPERRNDPSHENVTEASDLV